MVKKIRSSLTLSLKNIPVPGDREIDENKYKELAIILKQHPELGTEVKDKERVNLFLFALLTRKAAKLSFLKAKKQVI